MALEALVAELPDGDLAHWCAPVGEAANAALHSEPGRGRWEAAVAAMEAALRRHRLRG